jgi:uncharacterized membrane protein YdjX (TVP38/TMEM64 family)
MKINKKILAFLAICSLVGLYIAYKFGFAQYLSLENIKAHSQYFSEIVSKHYVISVIIYMIAYFLIIASAIPSTAPMSMIGGFLFGTMPTVVYSTIAATCGAMVSFLLIKFFSDAAIEDVPVGVLPKDYTDKVGKFRRGVQEYGSFYLLFLHFTFLVPFFVINSLAVISGVSFLTFIWTTFIGFLPCAYVYAFSGQKLLSIKSVNDIFSWHVILIIIMLLFIVSLPLIAKFLTKNKS